MYHDRAGIELLLKQIKPRPVSDRCTNRCMFIRINNQTKGSSEAYTKAQKHVESSVGYDRGDDSNDVIVALETVKPRRSRDANG